MADPDTNEEAQPRKSPPKVPDHDLLRCIGEGAYGEVWLARNSLGTFRAVKVIHCGRFKDNDRPYEREFTGLKNFEPISRGHEGLVDILQVGRDDDAGYFYYVMEVADNAAGQDKGGGSHRRSNPSPPHPSLSPSGGEGGQRPGEGHAKDFEAASYKPLTLEDKIHANGRLPVAECLRIAATLADALRYLHERELIHRDIKPSNIIFVDGVPKLADVGLVARTDSARTYVGTEGFLPPEGPGTPKADIYSLGKCLYEMAMGKDRQAFPSPPTLLDELPDHRELLELNEIINKACDPDPVDRYQNAQAMLEELLLLQSGKSVSGARSRRKRFRHTAIIGAAAGVCGLIAGLLWLVDYHTKPRILFQDDFDGAQLDTNHWTVGHAETRHEGRLGKPFLRAEQAGGEFYLQAKADSEDGWTVTQNGWLDLRRDLRKLAPCRLEIELAGSIRQGRLAVAISTGTAHPNGHDAPGVALASLERIYGLSGDWFPTTMRIDLLAQSEAAVVYPDKSRLDDFDIADLRGLSVWQLRFHCFTSSARGLPDGSGELRIKRVVVYRHPQPDLLIGRVIELPSRWPVQDALINDASGKTLVKTLANGAFVTDRVSNPASLTVEKPGYELVGVRTLGDSIGRGFVTVELRKNVFEYGDVLEVIPTDHPGATSIGFNQRRLNLLVHDSDSASRFVPVDTVNRTLSWESPEILQRSYDSSIGPLGFVECGTRLIGISHWPGRILDLSPNPPEVMMELNHPDGTRLNWPKGSAFDGQWLWFIENDFMNNRFWLHALDLERLVITNSFKSNDRGIYGLAWDGRQFWVSSSEGGAYPVDREAALRHGTIEMAKGRTVKGRYDALAFGDDYLWGLEVGRRRICKIKVTD
jgi:hypothetical protein